LAKPGVVPLPGATRGTQVTANARALAVRLSGDELAALDAAHA
jgi:aryl-alcohol dehydrogenase-like predicted oxidoreductase